MIAWLLAFLLLVPATVDATIRYVGTSGNDTTGNGTSGNRYLTPLKCIQVSSPGDTCLVGSGDYTDTDGNGIVVYITTSTGAPDGTASQPITLKSETPLGARLLMPGAASSNCYGVRITKSYYIIENFDITDNNVPTTQGLGFGCIGVSFGESGAAVGVILRGNRIHHIARNVCSDSAIGNAGVGGKPGSGVLLISNEIDHIGRKRNGEAGCSTSLYQNDHGIYVWSVVNFKVHKNVFSDNSRGYDLHVYAANQISTGLELYNNSFYRPSLTGSTPTACILLSYTNTDFNAKNNVFNNCPFGYAFTWFAPATQTNVNMMYNLSDSFDADLNNPGAKPSSGVTTSNNIVGSSTINFVDPANGDLRLLAGSAAIDAGTNVGYPANGATQTMGPFDPPRFSSCSITGANTIQSTFINNAAPLLPATGVITFTARKNGGANTVSGSIRTGDNIIASTTVTGYVGGDTGDLTYSSGNITASDLVGGRWNQPYVGTLSNQPCANLLAGVSYTITLKQYEWHTAQSNPETSPTIIPYGFASTGAAENYLNLRAVAGALIRLRVAFVCGVANCPDASYPLRYSANGGGYTLLPSTFGADKIASCGLLPNVPADGSATTNQLSQAGTLKGGGVIFTSLAIPIVTNLTPTDKVEMEYCVTVAKDATGFFDFRPYTDAGAAFNAYDVTPRLYIDPLSVGF